MAGRFIIRTRKQAVTFFTVFGIVALFLLLISIPFGHGIGTILILLLIIIALGLLRKKRPELFALLRKKKPGSGFQTSTTDRPLTHGDAHHTYMMLIGLNATQKDRILVDASPFVVGRDSSCNAVLTDNYVGRRHLIIEYDREGGKRYVTDCSMNGSYLNSSRLPKGEKCPVQHGDTLQMGGTAFSIEFVNY